MSEKIGQVHFLTPETLNNSIDLNISLFLTKKLQGEEYSHPWETYVRREAFDDYYPKVKSKDHRGYKAETVSDVHAIPDSPIRHRVRDDLIFPAPESTRLDTL